MAPATPVDVAAVLRDLKAEVRRRRHELQGEGAMAAHRWRGAATLDLVQTTARVNPHLPIAWPEWPPGIIPKVVALLQKVTRRLLRWYINPLVEQQNEFNAATAQALVDIAVEMRASNAQLEREFGQFQEATRSELAALSREQQVVTQRLWRLERHQTEHRAPVVMPDPRAKAQSGGSALPPVQPLVDYYQFELRHRGSPAAIRERQAVYLEYFRDCQQVLDVGCGRGEFVALLREHGIDARGVDIDAGMVAHCQAEGLPVIQADALSHLASLSDGSLDGIFMAQVVEHLSPAQVVQLLRACREKLAPDGVLVAETINPTCVFAFVQYYLMDPSHVHPWHAETLRFLLEDAGFWQIEVKYLSPVPDDQRLSTLPVVGLDEGQTTILNRNAERLNALLFGYQDYAVIARRSPDDLPEHG